MSPRVLTRLGLPTRVSRLLVSPPEGIQSQRKVNRRTDVPPGWTSQPCHFQTHSTGEGTLRAYSPWTMVANVYIDGFNFYYGCMKGTPYKWLDFRLLSQELLRGHRVGTVNYFTARVQGRAPDGHQHLRQDAYLRALEACGVEIYYGQFQTRIKTVRLAKLRRKKIQYVKAKVTEEKGTDVSLGSHLLWDAFHKKMDCAVILSNDADLQTPLDMAMQLDVKVITVNPHRHSGQADHLIGTERRNLRLVHLQRSQMPREMHDCKGRPVLRPERWDP